MHPRPQRYERCELLLLYPAMLRTRPQSGLALCVAFIVHGSVTKPLTMS